MVDPYGGLLRAGATFAEDSNASMAVTAGWKSSAIVVRPAPAFRLMPSVARAIRLYGSLKDRFAAVPAERVDTNHRCI